MINLLVSINNIFLKNEKNLLNKNVSKNIVFNNFVKLLLNELFKASRTKSFKTNLKKHNFLNFFNLK